MFGEAARQQGATAARAADVLRDLAAHVAPGPFYVYRVGGEGSGSEGGESGSGKKRTLLAFQTADDALAFAQRNRLGPTPRLLRLSLAQLLTIMMHRPSVEAVLFVAIIDDAMRPGQFPQGRRVARAEIIAAMTTNDQQ